MVVFFFGIFLAAILLVKKVKGALLISILASTVLAFIIELIHTADAWALNVPTFHGKELSLCSSTHCSMSTSSARSLPGPAWVLSAC